MLLLHSLNSLKREREGVGKDGVLIIFLLHVTVCVKRQSFYKAILPVVNIEMSIEQIFGRILCIEESFFGGEGRNIDTFI